VNGLQRANRPPGGRIFQTGGFKPFPLFFRSIFDVSASAYNTHVINALMPKFLRKLLKL
jgi:hypothetical protein